MLWLQSAASVALDRPGGGLDANQDGTAAGAEGE